MNSEPKPPPTSGHVHDWQSGGSFGVIIGVSKCGSGLIWILAVTLLGGAIMGVAKDNLSSVRVVQSTELRLVGSALSVPVVYPAKNIEPAAFFFDSGHLRGGQSKLRNARNGTHLLGLKINRLSRQFHFREFGFIGHAHIAKSNERIAQGFRRRLSRAKVPKINGISWVSVNNNISQFDTGNIQPSHSCARGTFGLW